MLESTDELLYTRSGSSVVSLRLCWRLASRIGLLAEIYDSQHLFRRETQAFAEFPHYAGVQAATDHSNSDRPAHAQDILHTVGAIYRSPTCWLTCDSLCFFGGLGSCLLLWHGSNGTNKGIIRYHKMSVSAPGRKHIALLILTLAVRCTTFFIRFQSACRIPRHGVTILYYLNQPESVSKRL